MLFGDTYIRRSQKENRSAGGKVFLSCIRTHKGISLRNMEKQLDYSEIRNWIHRPEGPFLRHGVDVFFAYPTVYIHPDKKKHHLMPVGSPIFRTAARISTWWHDRFLAPHCNIFAPYYRQVGMETLYMSEANFDRLSKTPYQDIRDAFFYYLEYCNGGRPFILAGHSQGSEMILKLLSRDLGPPELRARLIASYIIGYSVTRQDISEYPHLHLARRADDTDCIITYNTSAKGLKLLPVVLPGAMATNPLNWAQTDLYAPKSQNIETVFLQFGNVRIGKKHFTGARIDTENGVVMIDKDALDKLLHIHIGFLDLILLHRQTLHFLDIALFQENLQENVAARIAGWYASHPGTGV